MLETAHAALSAFMSWLPCLLVGLLALCLGGLFLIHSSHHISSAMRKLKEAGGYGAFAVALFVAVCTIYGGSKAWHRVPHGAAAAGMDPAYIYTGVSNDVVEVSGEMVTNKVYLVNVTSLGAGLTEETPVWVRMSETNTWTLLSKSDVVFTTSGETNSLTFTVSEEQSGFQYWFAGPEDQLPGVVHVTGGIEITGYFATGEYVEFTFECSDPLYTVFQVEWKRQGLPDYAYATATSEVNGNKIRVPGFWVDKNIDWRIYSSYDDEDSSEEDGP